MGPLCYSTPEVVDFILLGGAIGACIGMVIGFLIADLAGLAVRRVSRYN
jgi:gas vesicle protein